MSVFTDGLTYVHVLYVRNACNQYIVRRRERERETSVNIVVRPPLRLVVGGAQGSKEEARFFWPSYLNLLLLIPPHTSHNLPTYLVTY